MEEVEMELSETTVSLWIFCKVYHLNLYQLNWVNLQQEKV